MKNNYSVNNVKLQTFRLWQQLQLRGTFSNSSQQTLSSSIRLDINRMSTAILQASPQMSCGV